MQLDYINKVAPEHSRASCADDRPQNAMTGPHDGGGCMRCTLLQTAQLAAPAYESVATVLYLDGEKIIDGSLAFMDTAPAGTQLYAAPQGEDA